MDDNKILETLALILQGQTELKQDVTGLKQNVSRLENNMVRLENNMVRMENNLTDKIAGLYDFVDFQRNVNQDVAESLKRIEAKVDVLQMETAHLRRVK
jgi:hypothetical protein